LTSRERSAADDEVGRAKFPHEASDCHGTCGGGVDHARPLSRERKVAIEAERALRHDFGNALATWHGVQEVRRAALAQRSRELAQRARIHAALEDGALDLLYPSAKDELRDIVAPTDAEAPAGGLRAKYYRFLDSNGAVIKPRMAPMLASCGPMRRRNLRYRRYPIGNSSDTSSAVRRPTAWGRRGDRDADRVDRNGRSNLRACPRVQTGRAGPRSPGH
jgi:hypothetical protein